MAALDSIVSHDNLINPEKQRRRGIDMYAMRYEVFHAWKLVIIFQAGHPYLWLIDMSYELA